LAYIESGSSKDRIRILEFSGCPDLFKNLSLQISTLQQSWLKDFLVGLCQENYAQLIPQCSNVEFLVDADPPNTRFVSILFDLVENNVVKHYQINNALRSWAGNLLSTDGQSIVTDDD
jgi:hypothetical protein